MKAALSIFTGLAALSIAVRGLAPEPVINLDANAHEITAAVHCDGDAVTSISVFVDGEYRMTMFPLEPPQTLTVEP